MAYQGYTSSMTIDADDKIIVGRVLDIDDIVSFQGNAVVAFEAAFQAAVDGYIAACAQLGSAPEKPASSRRRADHRQRR